MGYRWLIRHFSDIHCRQGRHISISIIGPSDSKYADRDTILPTVCVCPGLWRDLRYSTLGTSAQLFVPRSRWKVPRSMPPHIKVSLDTWLERWSANRNILPRWEGTDQKYRVVVLLEVPSIFHLNRWLFGFLEIGLNWQWDKPFDAPIQNARCRLNCSCPDDTIGTWMDLDNSTQRSLHWGHVALSEDGDCPSWMLCPPLLHLLQFRYSLCQRFQKCC